MGLSNAERQRLYRARKATAPPDKVGATKRVLVPKGVERSEAVSCDHSGLWKVIHEIQQRLDALEKPGKDPLAYQKPTVAEVRQRVADFMNEPVGPWSVPLVSNDDPGDAP